MWKHQLDLCIYCMLTAQKFLYFFLLFLVKIHVITIAEVAEKADHSRGDQLTKLTSAMVTS